MIGKFGREHLEQCIEVHRKSFGEDPWNEEWSYEASKERLEDLFNTPKFHGLVYCDENNVKASIMGHLERMNDGYYYFLNEMFVLPEYKKKGIGSKLLSELEKYLSEKDCRLIFFFTSKEHRVSEFYEKNGYKLDEEMTMMEKEL